MVQPRVDVLQTYDASCLSCHQGPVAHTQSPEDLKFELALDCLLALKIALDCLLTLKLHWIYYFEIALDCLISLKLHWIV